MKNSILYLTVLIAVLVISGLILGVDSPGWQGKLLPAGMFGFAFIWMPFFLFYSYDRKQQRKHNQANTSSEEDNLPSPNN